jgi:acetylglutamate kinase
MSTVYNTQLFYCFTKAGVLKNVNDADSLVERLDKTQYLQMKQDKMIIDGMIPKLDTAFEALDNGVISVHLGTVAILSNTTTKHTTLCL